MSVLSQIVPVFTVVPAALPDAAQVILLCRQAKDVFPFLPRTVFETAVEKGELLVCRIEEQVIGGLHFHHRRDGITTVHDLVVAPAWQNRGVGRAMVEALDAQSGSRGQKRLRLKCPVDQPANGFYARLGFQRVGCESSRTRSVAVWQRSVTLPATPSKPWEFYASLTSGASDVRRLIRKYYEGYASVGQEPPRHPFQRMIFTPLFCDAPAFRLFKELASEAPNQKVTGIPFDLPHPTVMFDSGGYQVQMGRTTYEDLCARLRHLYAEEMWADWYVLPDHVPTSTDTDRQVEQKVRDTLAVGENFLNWFPERRDKFIGVVHGRTPEEMHYGAQHWHDLGVSYIAFGSFGTSGPNGSVNLVSQRSMEMLAALSSSAREHGQRVHIFGIGNPGYLDRFRTHNTHIDTFDSSNWWKMAGFGYVMGRDRTYRISQTPRQRSDIKEITQAYDYIQHTCPFCVDMPSLRTNRWGRILHNLDVFIESADRYN